MASDQLFELCHESRHGWVLAGKAVEVANHGPRILLLAGFLEGESISTSRLCVYGAGEGSARRPTGEQIACTVNVKTSQPAPPLEIPRDTLKSLDVRLEGYLQGFLEGTMRIPQGTPWGTL